MLSTICILAGVGLLIGFHELSHMLVSKLLNVRVKRFAFGFGPILLARTLGETSYELRLLPLGGFIQCAGEDPNVPEERGFFSVPWYGRALIALAGPAASFLLGYLLILAVLFDYGWPVREGLVKAASLFWWVLVETWRVLSASHLDASTISGPVMVTKILVDSIRVGLANFVVVLGVISMNLGMLNLLPLPALDGGHVFLSCLEGIRGRKLSARTHEIWNILGMSLLIGLSLLALYFDVLKLHAG